MNEAVIIFVSQATTPDNEGSIPYPTTKLVRVEFEGTSEQFLQALSNYSGTESRSVRFRVVSMEGLKVDGNY